MEVGSGGKAVVTMGRLLTRAMITAAVFFSFGFTNINDRQVTLSFAFVSLAIYEQTLKNANFTKEATTF